MAREPRPMVFVDLLITLFVSTVFVLGWGALAVSLGMQSVESLTRRGSTAASGRLLNIEIGARENELLAPTVEHTC